MVLCGWVMKCCLCSWVELGRREVEVGDPVKVMAIRGDQNSGPNCMLCIGRRKGGTLEWVSDSWLAHVWGKDHTLM